MTRLIALAAGLLLALFACNPPPDDADLDGTRGGRVDVYFNDPGSRPENYWAPDAEDVLVDLIDGAKVTLDIAVMGFSNTRMIDAVVRAYYRGVEIRFVGDAGHWYNPGYHALADLHIPMVTGNLPHIMHDKFFVVDSRFVFLGTANFSKTDIRFNSNNVIVIDSPEVAADFTAEFEQMFGGRFGNNKVEIDNGRIYQVGDTIVEVWFAPHEDAMGRILEHVDAAEESLRFTIFAFTKDQVGSSFIRKQEQFARWDALDGVSPDADFRDRRSVAGVIDQSQLHSNGQYHEAYRLLAHGIPLRLDGNDNSRQPGDYQFAGARLHSKTMVIDAHSADPEAPKVITGSFNWSSSATVSNDEFLLVLRSPRIALMYDDYFEYLWANGRTLGGDRIGDGEVEAGQIVINEVMWYGETMRDNPGAETGFDEFIELRNLGTTDVDLSMWQISNPDDFVVGLPPGCKILAGETFLILDHTLEAYVDGLPQDEVTAFANGDLVINSYNDNRQSRLYLKDGAMELILRDPAATISDIAGDGGPPFAGGPVGGTIRSMERNPNPGDGTTAGAWHECSYNTGGENVNPEFRTFVLATPGEENSP